MPINANFQLVSYEDGVLRMGLTPPAPVGGQALEFILASRRYATPFVTRTCASGYGGGQSGITITDSGNGGLSVNLAPNDVSGREQTNVWYEIRRTDSGYRTVISQGYRMLG